ncbi:MAG TPA: DegT/DnrJ/EryC1/StrS family aminotransferase [Sphingomicrobium sp.]|nr:DegT/DnrJ/EryC1/StrS family aminotransferase [Sphingomicrobium sp.]
MLVPHQIIYQIRYISCWFKSDQKADQVFRLGLNSVLGGASVTIPLGRARSGILLLVKHVVTEKRRNVIMSPYTIPDVVNMVKFGGGDPVFVDFRPNSTNVDLDHLKSLIDDRTACVLVTHYHIPQVETNAIADLCHSNGVKFFDDCAISLGASIEGKPIGTVSDASVFSFSGFKILNFFWGGAIAMPPGKIAAAIEAEVETWLRLGFWQYQFQVRKVLAYSFVTNRLVFPLFFVLRRATMESDKIVDVLPMSRMETTRLDDTIISRPALAAFGEWNRKFGDVADIVNHRRSIAAVYDRHFRQISVSAETPQKCRAEAGFVNYPIIVGRNSRNDIYRALLANNYDVALSLYPNVHEMKSFTHMPGRTTNVSELVRSIITLPTHTRVTPAYAEKLSRFLLTLIPND